MKALRRALAVRVRRLLLHCQTGERRLMYWTCLVGLLALLVLPVVLDTKGKVVDASLPAASIPWSLEDRFEIYFGVYREKLGTLTTLIVTMTVLSLAAISAMYSKRSELTDVELPIINISIDRHALRILVSSGLLFCWLQFGYLLNSILSDRIVLAELLRVGGDELQVPQGALALSLYGSLNDGGFVDLWFRSFLPQYVGGLPVDTSSRLTSQIIGALAYGTVLGLVHGSILALLYAEESRSWAYRATFLVFVVVLGLSHLQFWYRGGNENQFQFIVIGMGLAAFIALTERRLMRRRDLR